MSKIQIQIRIRPRNNLEVLKLTSSYVSSSRFNIYSTSTTVSKIHPGYVKFSYPTCPGQSLPLLGLLSGIKSLGWENLTKVLSADRPSVRPSVRRPQARSQPNPDESSGPFLKKFTYSTVAHIHCPHIFKE